MLDDISAKRSTSAVKAMKQTSKTAPEISKANAQENEDEDPIGLNDGSNAGNGNNLSKSGGKLKNR